VFGALSSSGTVTVTTSASSCRWTVKSNAAWLPFTFDPGRSGTGTFSYNVPGNNNPDPRDAGLVVSIAGGTAAIHTIHQERPVGCVYEVSPTKLAFGPAGGRGSFQVTTIPGDCQWRITDTWSGVQLATTSGTGAATVTYTVAPNASAFDRTFRVQGFTGLNPPGIHTVSIGS
jgi:hypothetical protein